ncbi:MAG: hypothetical protein M3680_09035 [Myxococcota bacterium]|nr:hypothetical protein [Myxococcota bacterium]
MKFRWVTVGLALIAATAFGLAVQLGRWWSVADVQIGPFGSRHCFAGDCQPAGLGWIGNPQWMRFGIATWAAGLIALFVLVLLAAGVASRRVPRLVAKCALVSIVTATLVATGFVALFPGVPGASLDRGIWLFAVAVVTGVAAAVTVLRARS